MEHAAPRHWSFLASGHCCGIFVGGVRQLPIDQPAVIADNDQHML
jgi:hypothetical protein